MKRKIILFIAMSLDGYIADDQDQLEFLDAYNDVDINKKNYEDLMQKVDSLIIGRKTFDVISKLVDKWPYENHHTYVITTRPQKNEKNIAFVNEDLESFLESIDDKSTKDIWLVGGGMLASSFMEKGYIDEYQITVIPKILGSGKKLFNPLTNMIDLKLMNVQHEDQIVHLTYIRK
jgi:dihydrofolate reductase